jgi:nucleotide-binding universal stress UspA family protein
MRVLLATDGSANARAATEWLAALLLPPTEVLVLTVAVVHPHPVHVAIPPELDDVVNRAARRAADAAAETLANRGHKTAVQLREGDPRQVIPSTASECGADLVVAGARGISTLQRLLLGSVSTAVVHDTACAVLVIKPHPRPLSAAIVALDGSADSLTAARFLARLPSHHPPAVRLLAVVEQPHVPRTAPRSVLPLLHAAVDDIIAERRAELEDALSSVRPEFEGKAVLVDTSVVATGRRDHLGREDRRAGGPWRPGSRDGRAALAGQRVRARAPSRTVLGPDREATTALNGADHRARCQVGRMASAARGLCGARRDGPTTQRRVRDETPRHQRPCAWSRRRRASEAAWKLLRLEA